MLLSEIKLKRTTIQVLNIFHGFFCQFILTWKTLLRFKILNKLNKTGLLIFFWLAKKLFDNKKKVSFVYISFEVQTDLYFSKKKNITAYK